MRLRGPARNALGQGPFSGEPVDSSGGAGAGALAGDSRAGGAVSQISSTPEIERDRAATAAAEEQRRSEAQAAQDPDSGSAPAGGVAPGAGRQAGREPPPSGDEPPEEEEDTPPAGPAVVRLIPSKAVFQIGETVVVQVVIDNAHNVGSAPFHLRYNTQALQFLPPGAEGPFMESDGIDAVFLSSDTGGGGEIVVGLSRMGAATGISGSGTLAVFQFQAIAPGDCGFAFTGASVKDPQARNLPAAFNTAAVRVE